MAYPTSPINGQIYGNKKYNSVKGVWENFYAPAIGSVYFQGPNDAAPVSLYPGTTWDDVSWEEANCNRRVAGSLSGVRFTGIPAKLSVTVTSGVPTITIVSGGSGYLNGSSGNLPLNIVGTCTTQMIATAVITNGAITSITVSTAGVGYTANAVAVYDDISGHGDLIEHHRHSFGGYGVATGSGASGNDTAGSNARVIIYQTGLAEVPGGAGKVRSGAETSGAWATVIKWRRMA